MVFKYIYIPVLVMLNNINPLLAANLSLISLCRSFDGLASLALDVLRGFLVVLNLNCGSSRLFLGATRSASSFVGLTFVPIASFWTSLSAFTLAVVLVIPCRSSCKCSASERVSRSCDAVSRAVLASCLSFSVHTFLDALAEDVDDEADGWVAWRTRLMSQGIVDDVGGPV